MPIYEYECDTCGRFEVTQKIADKPLKTCPNCKKKGKKSKIHRVISPTAFHLKGGGWYKDGYGSKKGAAAKSEGGSSSEPAPSTSSSTEKSTTPKKE